MADKILLALSTFPDAETARRISQTVSRRKIRRVREHLSGGSLDLSLERKDRNRRRSYRVFQAHPGSTAAFEEKMRSLHPYEVPEIIFFKIDSGLPEYLHWVIDNCRLSAARRF